MKQTVLLIFLLITLKISATQNPGEDGENNNANEDQNNYLPTPEEETVGMEDESSSTENNIGVFEEKQDDVIKHDDQNVDSNEESILYESNENNLPETHSTIRQDSRLDEEIDEEDDTDIPMKQNPIEKMKITALKYILQLLNAKKEFINGLTRVIPEQIQVFDGVRNSVGSIYDFVKHGADRVREFIPQPWT